MQMTHGNPHLRHECLTLKENIPTICGKCEQLRCKHQCPTRSDQADCAAAVRNLTSFGLRIENSDVIIYFLRTAYQLRAGSRRREAACAKHGATADRSGGGRLAAPRGVAEEGGSFSTEAPADLDPDNDETRRYHLTLAACANSAHIVCG